MWYRWNKGECEFSYAVEVLGDIFHGRLKNFLKEKGLFGSINLKRDEVNFELANIKAFWKNNVYSRILNHLVCLLMLLLQRSVYIYLILVVLYLNLRIIYYLILALDYTYKFLP